MYNSSFRGNARNYSFFIKSGNYTKNIVAAIQRELPSTEWKEHLIWTVQRFDFKESKYSKIDLIVVEYGIKLTFRTNDEGTSFELTIPELVTTPPKRKKFLGLF